MVYRKRSAAAPGTPGTSWAIKTLVLPLLIAAALYAFGPAPVWAKSHHHHHGHHHHGHHHHGHHHHGHRSYYTTGRYHGHTYRYGGHRWTYGSRYRHGGHYRYRYYRY